jgi:thioredoxin 1
MLIHNVVGNPESERVLLLVHGYGADERDLGGLLPYLDPEGHFLTVLPRGPVAAPPGFAWYELGDAGDGEPADPGFFSALDALDDLLDDICAQQGKARGQSVVAGFSQGGGLALALALRRSNRAHPGAALGMSTHLPEFASLDYDWEAAAQIPVLLQHGTEDPLIPVERARALAATLLDRGVPTTYREYPMGHAVALESVEHAHDWLDAVRAGALPSAPLPEAPADPLVKHVTTASFEAEVLRSELPVIVDFWAPWCGPCQQVAPILEQMAVMRKGSYKFVKINIDNEPQIAQAFEVQSIPLIGLFRNGRMERSSLGLKPRQQLEAELGLLVIP